MAIPECGHDLYMNKNLGVKSWFRKSIDCISGSTLKFIKCPIEEIILEEEYQTCEHSKSTGCVW